MRWVLLTTLVLAGLLVAGLIPSESGDVFYFSAPDVVGAVAADGSLLWNAPAQHPLIASDRAGRCLAAVSRIAEQSFERQDVSVEMSVPVALSFTPDFIATMRAYGISLPPSIQTTIRLELPLPPIYTTGVYKTAVVSLYDSRGHAVWTLNLGPAFNASAVATDCQTVYVAAHSGDVVAVRDGSAVWRIKLPAPVTALSAADAVYAGTADGRIFTLPDAREVGRCRGSAVNLLGEVALCFEKAERPRLHVWPYGLTYTDPAFVVIDGVQVPAARSQDGRWLFIGLDGQLVAVRDGREAWRAALPALPTAVAASWNGSIVAAATLAGHIVVFRNGVKAVSTDPISSYLLARTNATVEEAVRQAKPALGAALAFNGKVLAWQTLDGVRTLHAALAPYVVEAPPRCLPAEAAVLAGDIAYVYRLEASGVFLMPYGKVEVIPLYRYLGDVRCRPLRNITLTVFGDLEEPVRIAYVEEYKVEASKLVRGPRWASGAAYFYAEPSTAVRAEGPVPGARLVLADWEVNGRRLGVSMPAVAVDVRGPASVKALYRVVLPEHVQIDAGSRWRLVQAAVFNDFGEVIAVGKAPEVAEAAFVRGIYALQHLVKTAWPAEVNGTQELWADEGAVAVFKAPEAVDLKNGTRLVFRGWRGGMQNGTVVLKVDGPLELLPVYVRQYRVAVKPPLSSSAEWADRGAAVVVRAPTIINETADVRHVFDRWVVNGRVNDTLRGNAVQLVVREPLNITYTARRQYRISFATRFGQAPPPMWVDEGSAPAALPTPAEVWWPAPPIRWVFKEWRGPGGAAYVYGPGLWEAQWELDPLPLAAVAGIVSGAFAVFWLRRRRKMQKILAEVETT
jgi:hypothetical protein